ncbi:MAG: metal ABC transporter permease [Candidatus Promineifilaceae bacterium]|jgi:zinc/manganese transport system permease protein
MNELVTGLSILGPAFLTGVLVLATHVPLGREVLKRGIIFLDIAIAQIAALGVILAISLDLNDNLLAMQLIAVTSALLGALLLHFTEKKFPAIQEALIGSIFVLAATGALLLLANNPHGAEHLSDLLSGQILWVSTTQLLGLAGITLVILGCWKMLTPARRQRFFYPLFAIAITASVQLVGIYLVFSSLIIPALAMRQVTQHPVLKGYVLGLIAYGLGVIASQIFDLPTGPVIVWLLAATALVTTLFINGRTQTRSQ